MHLRKHFFCWESSAGSFQLFLAKFLKKCKRLWSFLGTPQLLQAARIDCSRERWDWNSSNEKANFDFRTCELKKKNAFLQILVSMILVDDFIILNPNENLSCKSERQLIQLTNNFWVPQFKFVTNWTYISSLLSRVLVKKKVLVVVWVSLLSTNFSLLNHFEFVNFQSKTNICLQFSFHEVATSWVPTNLAEM